MAVAKLDVAIGQLVCLREAIVRSVREHLSEEDSIEPLGCVYEVLDRIMRIGAIRTAKRLKQQVFIDDLTGCFSRHSFNMDVRRRVSTALRSGDEFTLVVIDMNNLKRVNDTLGHASGAEEIRRLASALRNGVDEASFVYRYGGDEFLLIMPGDVNVDSAMQAVLATGAPRFSWGSAIFGAETQDQQELFNLADRRLYEQRDIARGLVCVGSNECLCYHHTNESTVFAGQNIERSNL